MLLTMCTSVCADVICTDAERPERNREFYVIREKAMEGHSGQEFEGYCISRKIGLRDIIGSDKPVPYNPRADLLHAELFGNPPHAVLISWPAMDCSDMFDGEDMKPFIPHDSTKDAFDYARNDFVHESEDDEHRKNIVYYLIVFEDTLTVNVLDASTKKDLQLELIPTSVYHDRMNPKPLPTVDRPLKDAVTGQPVIDTTTNQQVTEKVVIICKEGIGQVYWRVAIDKKGAVKGALKLPKVKTAAELALERAQNAATNSATNAFAGLDLS